jgi:outer membrane protein
VKTYLLALPSLVLVAATLAPAQTQPANKVGVIQIQSASVSTKDGQKAAADLEARLGPKRKELEKKQTDIKDLQDKLQRGGNAMAETAKQDLMRTIDQRTKSFNRDMEDAQAEYDQEQRKLLDDLGQKMMQVIDKYAAANGYSVILDVSNPQTPVLYASNAIDITKDIIELYDKAAPSAAPAKPTAAPAPGAPKPAATPPPALGVPKPAAAPPAAPAPVKKQP